MKVNFWTRGRVILAGMLVFFLIFVLAINSLLAPIIGNKIKTAVANGSHGLYHLTFTDLSVNIFTGKAVLEQVRLTTDTGRFATVAQLYSGSAKRVLVTGAHPFKFWFSKKLEIGNISLEQPVVALSILRKPKAKPKTDQTIYQQLSESFRSIQVDQIDLSQVQLTYKDLTETYHLREMSLVATGLLIDPTTQRDTSRTLFCRDILVGIRNFRGVAADGAYHYELRSAHFSTRSEKLVARGMVIQPLPATAFFKKRKSDRFTITLDSMVLDHFNYKTFQTDNFLEVKRLSAVTGSMGVFSNPNGALSKTDRAVTFPNYIIRKLKTRFTVDTLDLSGIAVSYNEFNKESAKTGTLTFTNTWGRFLNITNEAKRLAERSTCTAKLSTLFMGAGKLDISFVFNLTDRVYAYRYKGHLAAMPLAVINPVLMPLALGKVKSGKLQSLNFAISGDKYSNKGTLELLYNNLTISMLDRNYHEKPVKTFIANALVVNKDNPSSGSQPRFAKIVFIRPKSYPFFKTLWATLLSGIKPCAGIGYAVRPKTDQPLSEKEQKAEVKALKKALKEKKKADEQHQKALRKQISISKKH